jgi:hypothetical protein
VTAVAGLVAAVCSRCGLPVTAAGVDLDDLDDGPVWLAGPLPAGIDRRAVAHCPALDLSGRRWQAHTPRDLDSLRVVAVMAATPAAVALTGLGAGLRAHQAAAVGLHHIAHRADRLDNEGNP